MRHQLLLLLALLVAVPLAKAQTNTWNYASIFPTDTLKVGNVHGLAVDPDGKVWIQSYYSSEPFEFADTVIVNGTKGKTFNINAIYVYNPDGTQATFSPILTLKQNGAVVDTLGLVYTGQTTQDGKSYATYNGSVQGTGRGMRASKADGHIYVSQTARLYRLNYQTGEMMQKTNPFGASLTAATTDDAGNVYVAMVASNGGVVKRFSDDLQELDASLVSGLSGFSRSFEVAPDGNAIYWAGYTNHAVHLYERNSEFDPFPTVPDTVLKGIDTESMAIHPVTGALWVSAGSPNDRPNQWVGLQTNYQVQTWYAFDRTQLSKTNPNPMPLDSIAWQGGGDGRPRGLAFTEDGEVAYIAQFSQPAPAVQKFIFSVANAVEPTGVVPSGLTLSGNAPNPFSGATTISFALPTAARASLKVYDTLGREVATLVDGLLAPDTYRAEFDASRLAAGVYVYRLQVEGHTLTRTMTVVR